MAWSYSKTITTNDRIWWGAGNGRLHWTRTWTVTELTPTQAGYIRLQMALSSAEYVAYADADGSVVTYNTTVTDTVSCGGQSVTIRSYTVGDTYTGYYSVEFQVPASWAGQTVTFTVTNNSQSVTFGATPAQPSTVGASDGYLGQAIPITLNRAISDVTHTVTVSCLGRTETLLTNSAEASTTWTPALTTYGPLLGSSASSATATISCETFYQGTSVGTDSATITVSLAASDGAPAGASGWAAASPYNSGAASGMSGWIQGFSQAEVSFDATKITLKYGATIAGYSITAQGETDSTGPYRTPVLQGQTQIQCKVTDSRGFTFTETLTVTPQSYAIPALSSIRAIRCDSLGAEDEDGTYCLAQATLTYSSLNGENQCGMWVSYKTRQASSYGAETALQSGTALLLSGLDPDQTYDVRIRAQDTLGGQVEALRTLMPRSWAMKFRPNGQGVGFGKAPTQQNELELGNGWVLKLNDSSGNSVTLSYAQLQQLLNLISGGPANGVSIPMGHLDSTSTATVMTAQVSGITELRDGVCVWLTNGVITSASGVTLNINGLGAKPLYSSLAAASRSTTIFNINYTLLLVYNSTRVQGGCWDVVYGIDSNTNTIGYQLRTNSTTEQMSEITYRYRLLFTSADGQMWVPANTSSSTNATAIRAVNQTKIDPHGPIVYYGATASVAAGSRPGAGSLWTQYVITLGYSFNRTGAALALTSYAPVFVKAAPQADGSAIIDPDAPFTQDLPTTDDGKIYIFLGTAVSATTIELRAEHPVYCYRSGGIQKWTGVQQEIDTLRAQLVTAGVLQST